MPRDYVLVGAHGTTAFTEPPQAQQQPQAAGRGSTGTGAPLGPGFGFVVTEQRSVADRPYSRIADGRWLPTADLVRVRPSTFGGTVIAAGQPLRFGWVARPEIAVRRRPSLEAPLITTRPFHSRIAFSSACRDGWCPLAVGWVRAAELALPSTSPRPGRVGPIEPWIDVDLGSQTLVAYRGDQPVYATLVSTGIGATGSPLATPTGVFTIESKHRLVRMDNLEHSGVVPYAYDVPLAQYFAAGKALHAAPWHDRFGHATSHGCINLAPRDAEWLFAFTSPALPRGATEVGATPARTGTAIQVRGRLPAPALR